MTISFKRFLAFSILGSLLLSCNFTYSRSNKKEDKEEAEKTANVFYDGLQMGQRSKSMTRLFSSRFWEVTPPDKLDAFLGSLDGMLGKMKDRKLVKWETKVTEGTSPSADYKLQYSTVYDKFPATETLTLEKENGQIRISGYHIESPAFLKNDTIQHEQHH